MTYKEALKYGYDKLKGTDQPEESARFLLRHVLNVELGSIIAYPENGLTPDQEERYKGWIAERSKHMPVSYITGFEPFYGFDFKVDERVLIPRPETEILVERVAKTVRELGRGVVIADIGTGSGAIGISLAKTFPEARIYLVDVSEDALAVARENVALNKAENVDILQGNLLEPLPEKVDILVANLPYIPSGLIGSLALDVHHYEPRLALEGGPDGLDLYRDLFRQAPSKVKENGKIFLEIGEDQGAKMVEIAKEYFPGAEVYFEKDWAGLDRFVFVKLKK